jgi:hypothetical protein
MEKKLSLLSSVGKYEQKHEMEKEKYTGRRERDGCEQSSAGSPPLSHGKKHACALHNLDVKGGITTKHSSWV